MKDTPKEAAAGDKAARDLMLSELLQVCTPAPWNQKHREGADAMYRTEIFSFEHGGIATCKWTPQNLGNGVTGTYCESNAKLIALAPTIAAELIKERAVNAKLLEALKSCFDYPSDTFDINAEANFSMTVSGFHLHQVADAIKQAEEL